jgi:hypothetical protein
LRGPIGVKKMIKLLSDNTKVNFLPVGYSSLPQGKIHGLVDSQPGPALLTPHVEGNGFAFDSRLGEVTLFVNIPIHAL